MIVPIAVGSLLTILANPQLPYPGGIGQVEFPEAL